MECWIEVAGLSCDIRPGGLRRSNRATKSFYFLVVLVSNCGNNFGGFNIPYCAQKSHGNLVMENKF